MGGHSEPNLSRTAAEAEAAVRGEAAAVQDPELRTRVLKLADAVHRISKGSPNAPRVGSQTGISWVDTRIRPQRFTR